jgi:hypothetical protein
MPAAGVPAPLVAGTSAQRRWTTGALSKAKTEAEYDAVLATCPTTPRPRTLQDFGYTFADFDATPGTPLGPGRLRQIADPSQGFAWLGQKHYDFIGEAIVEEIYTVLQRRYGMLRLRCPMTSSSGAVSIRDELARAMAEARSAAPTGAAAAAAATAEQATEVDAYVPIFATPNCLDCEVLVLLCQGSGAVRPGMWARALCINDTLDQGCIFGYLDRIISRGWGVVVLNPNENTTSPPLRDDPTCLASFAAPSAEDETAGEASSTTSAAADAARDFFLAQTDASWKEQCAQRRREAVSVSGSESPVAHGCYVWQHIAAAASAKAVPIIAHSYGGIVTLGIADAHFDAVCARVPAVAFTDAINQNFKAMRHQPPVKGAPAKRAWLAGVLRNWVASDKPLDTPVDPSLQEVSSGHTKHEYTSASCTESLFAFLDAKVAAWLSGGPAAALAAAGASAATVTATKQEPAGLCCTE